MKKMQTNHPQSTADFMAKPTRRAVLLGAGVAAGSTVFAPAVFGQGLSNRNVSVVVPFSAGTAPDILARRVAEAFQRRWQQAFVIDNRPGASGTIGASAVARGTADGHTLLVTPSTLAMSPSLFKTLPYDPITGFEPIVQLATIGFGLLLHRSAGADVASFVKRAKEKPGELLYATPGRGTPHHLAMELFKQKAGVDVRHVPSSNFASALTNLLSGEVSAMFATITIAKSLPTDGSVKLVGVASPVRLPSVQDTPTFAELGFPGVEVLDWYGMFAPAKTPQSIISRLNITANEILADQEMKTALASQGMVPVGGSPTQLQTLLRSDITRWGEVIRAAGITQD